MTRYQLQNLCSTERRMVCSLRTNIEKYFRQSVRSLLQGIASNILSLPIKSHGRRDNVDVIAICYGWTVRGSNNGGGRDFPCPSRPSRRPMQYTSAPLCAFMGMAWRMFTLESLKVLHSSTDSRCINVLHKHSYTRH